MENLKVNINNFKVKLCEKWSNSRTCPYGMKCTFAHGNSDLMKQGEYVQKHDEKIKKRYSLKEVHPLKKVNSVKQLDVPIEINEVKFIEINEDYDLYWKIIHDLIIEENFIYLV
jgi:hypothetical protein